MSSQQIPPHRNGSASIPPPETSVAHSHHYRMERVLYNLHHQLCTGALRRTSRRTRTLVEHGVLILSVCCFGVLLLVHWSFVYRGGTALSPAATATGAIDPVQGWTTDELACLPTSLPAVDVPPTASCASPNDERTASTSASSGVGPRRCLSSVPGFRYDADITHLSLLKVLRNVDDNWTASSRGRDGDDGAAGARIARQQRTGVSYAYIEDSETQRTSRMGVVPGDEASVSSIYYSHSRVKGYLLLSPDLCRMRNLTVQHVVVSPSDARCFGEPFLRKLVFGVTGVDTVMVNWFLEWGGAHGYLLNPRVDPGNVLDLGQLYSAEAGIVLKHRSSRWRNRGRTTTTTSRRSPLNHGSDDAAGAASGSGGAPTTTPPSVFRQLLSKLAVVAKTSFLFFIITTLVSFTLRETQERMIDFTHQLRELYAHGGDDESAASASAAAPEPPTGPVSVLRALVPTLPRVNWHVVPLVIRHLAENLLFVPIMIGMIFFLIEFYRGDKFLAFVVVSLVWLCEVFTVISLRSSQGLHFFPRIFFLLFSLFHFYVFLYPFGFCYTALASTALFMTHSMLFFWHRYELPAVAHGHVTLEHPRMGPWPTSHHHQHHSNSRPIGTDSEPPRTHHLAPYGPTPPGIPNILLPARRTSTPSLLRHPTHNSSHAPASASRAPVAALTSAGGAAAAAEPHPALVRVEGSAGSGGDIVMSRPTSSVALVRDDDSSSSYLYFMDGEVVLHGGSQGHPSHRDSRLFPSMQRAGSFSTRLPDARRSGSTNDVPGYESALRHQQVYRTHSDNSDVDGGSSSLQSVIGNPYLDDRSLLAVLEPPETSRLHRRELFLSTDDADSAHPIGPDPPEMSSLQAILFRGGDDDSDRAGLNGASTTTAGGAARTTTTTTNPITSSSTPRADNRSSSGFDDVVSGASTAPTNGAPSVPLLRSRRKGAGTGGHGSIGSGP